MSRFNLRLLRGLAGATTLALLASALLSAPALAANAREVFFGTSGLFGGGYDTDGDLLFGQMSNTKVTSSGKSKIDLLIRNDDGQTLNHVRVAGGDETEDLEFNPDFNRPSGTSLGSASIASFVLEDGPAGASCESDTSGFICDIGTLSPQDSASFTIVLNAPAGSGANPYWFTASWNEGWSSTGTNADYNFAVDNLDVLLANCTNGTASWFLATETVNLSDGDTSASPCGVTSASVRSGQAVGGGGAFAQVVFDTALTKPVCPPGVRQCVGNTVDVQILEGNPVPGGVIWTLQVVGTKTLGGVIHYEDDYDPEDPDTFAIIPLTKKFKCSATLLTDCWNSVTPSPGGVKPAYVIVEFVTAANGKGGGWI